ncbi:unnamed protein product [Haemonchus placei]|uniref:Uncharacterized protein n=1 Tax=Haemonchus placei TaxID=6290 RepID=A0A0N4WB05_HAEPC|nr:unnamed protein product [Haemonchus placei]
MFGCITHQPRRHRPRNFEDEPSNLRSRSLDAQPPPKPLPFGTPPKPTGRLSSTPLKPSSLKGAEIY